MSISSSTNSEIDFPLMNSCSLDNGCSPLRREICFSIVVLSVISGGTGSELKATHDIKIYFNIYKTNQSKNNNLKNSKQQYNENIKLLMTNYLWHRDGLNNSILDTLLLTLTLTLTLSKPSYSTIPIMRWFGSNSALCPLSTSWPTRSFTFPFANVIITSTDESYPNTQNDLFSVNIIFILLV